MNNLSDIVTPARVVALLTAVAPYAISTLDGFKTLPVPTQVAVIAGLVVVGCTFIVCYSRYVTERKKVQLQLEATT